MWLIGMVVASVGGFISRGWVWLIELDVFKGMVVACGGRCGWWG